MKRKTVRAWAVMSKYSGKLLTPPHRSKKHTMIDVKNLNIFSKCDLYTAVPCTITYELPRKGKKVRK